MSNKCSWPVVPLGALILAPPQNGYSPVCPDSTTGKWILSLSALNGTSLVATGVKPAPANDLLVDKFLLKPGDFLISRSNTLDKVGRVGVFRGEVESCSYPDLMMRFRPDNTKVHTDYLEVYLKSEEVQKFIQRHAAGTSGSMKKINRAIVESIPVVLPILRQQEEIASISATWNAAIEKTETLIVAKQQFLNAIYQECFSPKRLAEPNWKRFRISQLLQTRTEKAIPSENVPLYSLTIENGITAKTDRYEREFLVRDVSSKTYKVVCPGDIVFNPSNLRWGAIARSEIKHKVLVSPIYEVLEVVDDLVNPDLLLHALTCQRQIKLFSLRTEGTLIERMAVKLDTFLLTSLILPEARNQQDVIATAINEAKHEIVLLGRQIDEYRTQKRGLMQKLLTGHWRVKAGGEVAQ
jgi:type I restriction enzyme, S subunit